MIDGTARRLPSWMTAEATKTASANSFNENKSRKKHSYNSISTDSKQTTSDQNSFSLKQCVTKKRKKLQVIETDRSKKRKNGTSTKRNAKDDESLSFSDDAEDDFTVEDLVSIAEEYVKNEESRAEKRLIKTEDRAKRGISEIGSCVSDVEGAVIAGDSEQVESSDKIIVESSEQCRVQVNRTGDPARDMLDLFLGPLLNRPVVEDKKIDCLKNYMDFSCQLVKENRHDFQKEVVVPSKKKSSLKNTVSMLID